jgi:hypothetical protein
VKILATIGGLAIILAGCCPKSQGDALSCRGGQREGSQYHLKTVIITGAVGATVSYAPIRCPNLEFAFHGQEANKVAVEMIEIAKKSAGGKATFEIDATGDIDRDDKLQVPIFVATNVHFYSKLY